MAHGKLTKAYMISVLTAGSLCGLVSVLTFPVDRIDFYLIALFAFTIGFGSRMTIRIPRLKSHVNVSDTFIFLALLTYGAEIAIILAAAEAFFSSWRFCNKKITIFFNAAGMALSTATVVVMLRLLGLYHPAALHPNTENIADFFVALSVIALTQFVVNTSLASIYDSLKDDFPLWDTWKNKYIWVFFSYFVGAVGAGLLVQLSDLFGSAMVLAAFPVIFFVFLTYRMYMQNVDISVKQAEQASNYAEILQQQSAALRESEERFRSAFDNAPIGIALVSPTGRWLKVNHALCGILGRSEAELLETDFQSLIFKDDLGPTLARIHELLSGTESKCQMEQRYIHCDGRTVWASWSASTAGDNGTGTANLIFQIQDVTENKEAEARLQHDATHDALTGLPNRLCFMARLTDALVRRHFQPDFNVSVLFIDLDRFKYVNDSLGHLIGDELLVGISKRLCECLRPSDLVARLGGDEFVILVEGCVDLEEVTAVAERIQQKLALPFRLRGHEVYSSASIGIVHASDTHRSSEDIMRDADTAMYQAKHAGKARHAVFADDMHEAAKETLKLETALRRAVENREINVVYQPIYSLPSGDIQGVEALARWTHPDYGEVPPKKFIALAEEIGLIETLSEQLLHRSCIEIGAIQESLCPDLNLSMNLSLRQFGRTDLVPNILKILGKTNFRAETLRLEITESILFEYQETAIGMLDELCNAGIRLVVDDFGTGYSNLGYLMRLPISTLKVDRSFTGMINEEGKNVEIVRAIVQLAKNLGLNVVAEGVESGAQLDSLVLLRCDAAQGFFLSRPLAFEALCDELGHGSVALASPLLDESARLAA